MIPLTVLASEISVPEWAVVVFSIIGGQATILAVIQFGAKAFQRWFMSEVIDPHVKPMQEDLKQIKTDYALTRALVATHDAVLSEHDKHIAMLQGKVFGGIPVIGKGKPDIEETVSGD